MQQTMGDSGLSYRQVFQESINNDAKRQDLSLKNQVVKKFPLPYMAHSIVEEER